MTLVRDCDYTSHLVPQQAKSNQQAIKYQGALQVKNLQGILLPELQR